MVSLCLMSRQSGCESWNCVVFHCHSINSIFFRLFAQKRHTKRKKCGWKTSYKQTRAIAFGWPSTFPCHPLAKPNATSIFHSNCWRKSSIYTLSICYFARRFKWNISHLSDFLCANQQANDRKKSHQGCNRSHEKFPIETYSFVTVDVVGVWAEQTHK